MYYVSYANSFMSTNWKEESFTNEREAEEFAKKKAKQGYCVLPVEYDESEELFEPESGLYFPGCDE